MTLPPSGVDGDSVPMRDFLAADRGVMLPLMVGVDWPSIARFFALDSVCRPRFAGICGDALLDPKGLGVTGLLVCRKAELRLGVRGLAGLPWFCLSMGMLCIEGFFRNSRLPVLRAHHTIVGWRRRWNGHGERSVYTIAQFVLDGMLDNSMTLGVDRTVLI